MSISKATFKLSNEMRMLWEQHATWTSMAITSIVFKLPNENEVVNRLLRNPVDFGFALLPYYGDKKAFTFKELLTEHLQLAAKLIKEIMAGDTNEANKTEARWYENANEISKFLSSINPCWSEKEWKEMFHEHLGIVKALALTMINGNYTMAVELQDELEQGTLMMADDMTRGIVRRFPRKFR